MRVFLALLALGRHASTPSKGQAFHDLALDINALDTQDVDVTNDQSATDRLLDAIPANDRWFLRSSSKNTDVAVPIMIDPSMSRATSAQPAEVATPLNMANLADEPSGSGVLNMVNPNDESPLPTVIPPSVAERPPLASAGRPVDPFAQLAEPSVGSWRTNPHHCKAHTDCQSAFCGFLPASPRVLDPVAMGGYVCAPCVLCVPTSNRTPNGSADGQCPACYARR